jgi:nucleoside-diphosphate-sugar epimerase
LEECKNKEDIVFNFISSWFVYGKTNDLPAKEDSYCMPKGFYSITKRTAEQLIISYCETFGINYRILRLCNVYGTADLKASKKRNALQFLIREIVNNRDINLYDAGENIRDFMHVEDICRAINLVIDEAPLNDIINIGSGIPHKFIDIMTYVKEKTNSTSNFNFVDPPEFHKIVQIQDMYLDVTKLKNLKFKPKYTIWNGIDILIDNTKKQNEQ